MSNVLYSVYFSPSGTSEKMARLIAENLKMESRECDITTASPEGFSPEAADVVLLAVPVYAGRVPQLAAERIRMLRGQGQKAIAVAVYGNRDYDDALLELCDIAGEQGFKVVAAAAFIAEHCIFPKVAKGRPDASDEAKAAEFAACLSEALAADAQLDVKKVKGNRPYKKPGAVPIHPGVDKKLCNSCCTCADECPTNAIDPENPQTTDGSKCITCCRCIKVCPEGARGFSGMLYKAAGWKFTKDNARRLEPEWFV